MSTYFYSNVIWLESGYKMSPLASYLPILKNQQSARLAACNDKKVCGQAFTLSLIVSGGPPLYVLKSGSAEEHCQDL